MPLYQNLSTEDRAQYRAWMRGICSVYAVAIALALALATLHATAPAQTAESLNNAMMLAGD
jgi:hypothetical protein